MIDLLILLLFIIGSALFSGLETGMISINTLRMQHLLRQKNRNAKIIQTFLDDPEYLLGTTLVGTNLCNVALSVASASLLATYAGKWASIASLIIVTPIVLILGEYLPKAWFQSNPEKRTLLFAPIIKLFGITFYPVSKTVSKLAKIIIPTPANSDKDTTFTLTRDELQNLANHKTGGMTAHLSEQKSDMIQGVLSLTDKIARDVMTPISQVTCIKTTMTKEQITQTARKCPHHRFPVIDEKNAYVGVLHILDWLEKANTRKPISEIMRPPQFILETDITELLLPRIQLSRQPMLLVRTKRAEVIGIITMQNILSLIVATEK